MKEVEFRDLYQKVLHNFTLEGVTGNLLLKIIAGSDKGLDYEEVVRTDRFLTTKICAIASEGLKSGAISSVGHGMALVGIQKVRNALMGHCLKRMFFPDTDERFSNLDDAEKNLKYSIAAEDLAKKCGCEYKGSAFAAGFVFDIFATWITKNPELQTNCGPLLEEVWKHGVATASLAWNLANHESIVLSQKKNIFTAGLLHEIGRLVLGFYSPSEYAECSKKIAEKAKVNSNDDAFMVAVEKEFFDITHMEAGSALVFQMKALREDESLIDFHHDPILLKTRSPDAFLGVAVINMADRLAWAQKVTPNLELDSIKPILKDHAAYIPFDPLDIQTLFNRVKAKGLLTA